MLIPIEKLVDGVLRTLEHEVLPGVSTRFARGQLYAVLDVLNNLRDRVEEKAALHGADADAAGAALADAAAKLHEAGAGEGADAAEQALRAAPEAPAAERAAALRRAVTAALGAVAALGAAGAPAHEALRGYLVSQAIRDVLPLKRSRLGEISKG